MYIAQYVESQNKRQIYFPYTNRQTSHILEDECKYLMHKLDKNFDFIVKLHMPIKSFFLEMQLQATNETTIQILTEMSLDSKKKTLSKTFIGWLLSFILTQKMLLNDISTVDCNAISSEIKSKKLMNKSFLDQYSAYNGICGNEKIEFIYFEMSYPGFQNMEVCLESGLALYYFSALHKSYYKKE